MNNDITFDILKQKIGIDQHLSFIESLLKKYEWDLEKRTNITLSIKNILNKENDPNLYLGIIGEFSSGKSTFINAIICDDLLRTDVLQATASATIIRYGIELYFKVKYKNRTTKIFRQYDMGKENLKLFLHQVTTNEDVAKEVEQIIVYHPSEFLRNNIIIIDTPGINVDNERHIQVTEMSIREMCDTAIILIPANIPISQTLTYFLDNHLSDILHRCIFVVTKIDLIRTNESERLLKYVKDRIKSNLKLEQPTVFVSTPLFIIDELIGNKIEESKISKGDKQNLIDQSKQTEKEIYRIIQEQRLLIILERLSKLLSSLFDELKYDLQEMEKGYVDRHQALEKNRITDLVFYTKQQKDQQCNEIKNQSYHLLGEINKKLDTLRKDMLTTFQEALNKTSNDQILRSIMVDKYPKEMQKTEETIQEILVDFFKTISEIGYRQFNAFENDFKILYKSLETLDGHMLQEPDKPDKQNISMPPAARFDDYSQKIGKLIKRDESIANWKAGSGFVAGAAIGTTILPGIGTIVGGFIGLLFGASTIEPTDKLRENYWNELQKAINDPLYQTEKDINKIVDKGIESMTNELNRIVDHYFEHYGQLVEQMIKRDEAEAAELEQHREIIQEDLSQLESRQQQLSSVKEILRSNKIYEGGLYAK